LNSLLTILVELCDCGWCPIFGQCYQCHTAFTSVLTVGFNVWFSYQI